MKKGILLILTFVLSASMFGQMTLSPRNEITQKDRINIQNRLKINEAFKKRLTSRTSSKSITLDYVTIDSILQSTAPNAVEKSFAWDMNYNYDTLNLPSAASGFTTKGFIQGYTTLSYLDNNNNILSINSDSSTITIDSINPILSYDRVVTTGTDTLIILVYEDSFNYGVNPSTGFTQNLSGVKFKDADTVYLTDPAQLDTYMFRKSITLDKGNGFLVQVKFLGNIENTVRGIASYSTVCDGLTDKWGLQSRLGFSHYSMVYKPSTGNPFRFAVWNSSALNTTESCKMFLTQNWFVFPFITVTSEPNVLVANNQTLQTLCKDAQVQLYANATGFSSPNLTYSWSPATGLSSTTVKDPMVTVGTANATYMVTVSDGTTSVTASANITSGNIAVTLNTVALTSCADSNKTLTATVTGSTLPKTYIWSQGTSTTAISSKVKAGSYSVTVSNVACTATATTNVTMAAGNDNTLDFSYSPTTPKVNENVAFTNSSSKQDWNFTWKVANTTFSTLVTPDPYVFTTSGAKSVSLSASLGACTATPVTKTITVNNNNVAISSINLDEAVKFYPNPTRNGLITIENNSNNSVSFKITDILGKTISVDNVKGTSKTLDLSHNSNGVYFVEIESKGEKITRKLVINKD